MQIREQGWECPRCERVWAPKIGACGACNTDIDFSRAAAPQMGYGSNWNFNGDDLSWGHDSVGG